MILNCEFFTWSHTKVWQSISILQWGAQLIPKHHVFFLRRIIEVFKKKGENPRINILVDWLNVKHLHWCHYKIVKWLNQTKHTLWGSPRRDLQKDRMRSHVLSRLSKRDSQSMFSTKEKKQKKKKSNQNHKNRKECHEHYTILMIQNLLQSLHLLHSKMKVACICIPKIMFILGYKYVDFSLYTNFPNLMSYTLSLAW